MMYLHSVCMKLLTQCADVTSSCWLVHRFVSALMRAAVNGGRIARTVANAKMGLSKWAKSCATGETLSDSGHLENHPVACKARNLAAPSSSVRAKPSVPKCFANAACSSMVIIWATRKNTPDSTSMYDSNFFINYIHECFFWRSRPRPKKCRI